jgi:beta-glucosidase-like glycosyl hydrolase
MPDSTYFGDALRNAVNDKSVPQSRVDDMALRILRSIYAAGLADTPQTGTAFRDIIPLIQSVFGNWRRPVDHCALCGLRNRLALSQSAVLTYVVRAAMPVGVQAR